MPSAFEIKTYSRADGDEIHVTRCGPFEYVVAAQINRRLAELGASLVRHDTRGWYLRSGKHRSEIDLNTTPKNTLVLIRTHDEESE